MATLDQIKELQARVEALTSALKIEELKAELEAHTAREAESSFWDDAAKAAEAMRLIAPVKSTLAAYDATSTIVEDLALMPEFVREGLSSEEEFEDAYLAALDSVESLEVRKMLSEEQDSMPAIMEINSGVWYGGFGLGANVT